MDIPKAVHWGIDYSFTDLHFGTHQMRKPISTVKTTTPTKIIRNYVGKSMIGVHTSISDEIVICSSLDEETINIEISTTDTTHI